MNARIDMDEFARFCERSRAAMEQVSGNFARLRDDFETALKQLEFAISDLAEPNASKKPSGQDFKQWDWTGHEHLRDLPRNLKPRAERFGVTGSLSRGLIRGPCVASAVLAILLERELVEAGAWVNTLEVAQRARAEGFQQSKTFREFLGTVVSRGRVLERSGIVERTGYGARGALRIAPNAVSVIKDFGSDIGVFVSNAGLIPGTRLEEEFQKELAARRKVTKEQA